MSEPKNLSTEEECQLLPDKRLISQEIPPDLFVRYAKAWITLFPLYKSLVPKTLKCHFLGCISNSYHGVTVIGLEPPQKNFGENFFPIQTRA